VLYLCPAPCSFPYGSYEALTRHLADLSAAVGDYEGAAAAFKRLRDELKPERTPAHFAAACEGAALSLLLAASAASPGTSGAFLPPITCREIESLLESATAAYYRAAAAAQAAQHAHSTAVAALKASSSAAAAASGGQGSPSRGTSSSGGASGSSAAAAAAASAKRLAVRLASRAAAFHADVLMMGAAPHTPQSASAAAIVAAAAAALLQVRWWDRVFGCCRCMLSYGHWH
jgi:hypothetical protein